MTANSGADELRRELAACHSAAYAWALGCCRHHRTDAEDVLQAVYLKVLDGSARFHRRSSFSTWLFAVIRVTAADARRRRLLRDLFAGRWATEEANREPAAAADADAEQAQQRAALLRALNMLPARQREVVLLVFYHEMSIERAAQVMAIGVGTARQHYARAKARLRHLLSEAGAR